MMMMMMMSGVLVVLTVCSLYDSDVSQDWYSPSYSPPDHAYTPTGDVDVVVDDYPTDDDYSDDYDWRYDDDRPRGTGRKLPAPPPTSADYGWPPPPSAVDGEPAAAVAPSDGQQPQQPRPTTDSEPLMNGYAADDYRDYADYNGYYDAADDYYDGSDGYDRTSELYDDRYYMSFDGEYGEGLVNGYVDGYVHGGDIDQLQQTYYDYSDKSYDVGYAPSSQYDGTERSTDVDEQSVQYRLPPLPLPSSTVHVDDAGRHDAIYDDGYVDHDGVYRRYDDRYDDARRYGGKYAPSVPSDAGESAYDVDELNEDVMSSVPARSSIDSSATAAAARYDRYYDVKTDSFDSYDRDATAYDAATSRKDSGYQTFNQQLPPPQPQPPPAPSDAEFPYFNHVDVSGWQQPAPSANGGDSRRSPITVLDAQAHRQSFVVGRPAENTFAPSADQRWPAVSPSAAYSDGLPSAPAAATGFCDTLIATPSVDSTSFGSVPTFIFSLSSVRVLSMRLAVTKAVLTSRDGVAQ